MSKRTLILSLTIVGGVALFAVLRITFAATPSQGTAQDRAKSSKPDAKAAAQRPKLQFDEKELPGRYYFGDGLGVNCSLTLKADHRFTFSWHGCLGEYDRNQGNWKLEGDTVVIKPENANRREGFEGMNVRFIPVKWGARVYLVDENEMPGFCATARKAKLPTLDDLHGNDYVKWDGEKLPPLQGKPVIPERYREFYDKGPVEVKVIRIDPAGHVVLDKGASDRLKPGMLLAINAFDRKELQIISTEIHEAVAKVNYFWNSDSPIKVGDIYTTGNYWNRPWGTGYERFSSPPEAKKAR